MAKLTRGYSYAFQVLGYIKWEEPKKTLEELLPLYDQYLGEYVYSKIWSELSQNDKRVVIEMSGNKETRVTAIREKTGMTSSEFSVYRDRLKRKGLIDTSSYGRMSLTLPRFEEYAIAAAAWEFGV